MVADPRHSLAVGTELHVPKGFSGQILKLPLSATDGMLWQTSVGNDLLRFDTTNKNLDFSNATDPYDFRILGGKFIFTGTTIDLDPTGEFNLAMDSGQAIKMFVSDNLGEAWSVKQSTNVYFSVSTLNGTEQIDFGGATNPTYIFAGTSDIRLSSQIRFTERAGDPSSVAANGFLYNKDSTGSQLFWQDDTGIVTQLTKDGSPARVETTTVNATPIVKFTLTLATDETIQLTAYVASRATNAQGGWWIRAVVFREASGVATFAPASPNSVFESEEDATMDADFTVSGNDVRLTLTGVAATTVNWEADIHYQRV